VGFGILNTYIAILEGRRHGIPVVYYLIDELHKLIPIRALQRVGRLVETSNMKNATSVLAINEALLDSTIEMGARRETAEVVRAGVDPARFQNVEADEVKKLRMTLGFSDEDIVLFFMGWLYPFSGLQELATELAHPRWRERGIRLLIVGKGELRDRLQEIIISNGLKKDIVLLDWLPYSEIPKYILASTVCILPSHNNDIMRNIVPIKMYEYLAAGKPVLATDIPGIRKEFGCGNGVVYVHNATEILQTAIELSIRGRIVEEGERGRRFVERLTWDQVTDKFESILTKIAVQHANAQRVSNM
jgi:glycosyltransferase involved in cell wall biosynthesis